MPQDFAGQLVAREQLVPVAQQDSVVRQVPLGFVVRPGAQDRVGRLDHVVLPGFVGEQGFVVRQVQQVLLVLLGIPVLLEALLPQERQDLLAILDLLGILERQGQL